MLNSRQKGKRGEIQAVTLFNEMLSTSVDTKTPKCINIEPRVHSQGADFYVPKPWNLNVEVKRAEIPLVNVWWKQTLRQAAGKTPVLMYRANRKPWKFCIPATELIPSLSSTGYIELDEEVFAAWLKTKCPK